MYPSHVINLSTGKLVKVLVNKGDFINEGDVVCFVQQMKVELEARAQRGGRIVWVIEAEGGEEVSEGTLTTIVKAQRERSDARL